MIVRPLIESDYKVLCSWWQQWGWTPPSKDFLPQNGLGGIIVFDEDIPVCSGFLYTTNSKVAWVEFIISNKEYKQKEKRKKSITLLIDSLTNIAEENGYKYVYAILKHKGLIKTYESLGYIKGDVGSEMIKIF